MLEITDANFESEVLQSDIPVVLDFWAPWCSPCRALAPHFEKLAGEYEGKVKAGKVNLDNARALAQKYGVLSIPVVMSFSGGEVKDRMTGFDGTDKSIRRIFEAAAG